MDKNESAMPVRAGRSVRVLVVVAFAFLLGLLVLLGSIVLDMQGDRGLLTSLLRALGEVLLISSTITVAMDFLTREGMLRDFRRVTDETLERAHAQTVEFFDRTIRGSNKYGLVGLTDEAVYRDLFSKMRSGDTLLWLDTYSPGYQGWMHEVEARAREGCKFKLLALRPESRMARLRATELGDRFVRPCGGNPDRTIFDEEMSAFIADFRSLAERINAELGDSRIEIRIYDDLLGTPLYLIERNGQPEFGLSSFYLAKATGMNFPHLEWRRTGDHAFIRNMAAYFHGKWEKSALE